MTANYLASAGKGVLLMDADYGGCTTLYYLESRYGIGNKGFSSVIKRGRIRENIAGTRKENIDIVPSDAGIEGLKPKGADDLSGILGGEAEELSVYDYIIIDTSQGYNAVTANVIRASDLILTPLMMCQFDLMSCLGLQNKMVDECGKYEEWRLFFNGVNRHILNPKSASYQYMAIYRKTFNNCAEVYIPRTTAVVNAIDREMKITRKEHGKLYTAVQTLAGIIAGGAVEGAEGF
jgi:cellulose biosynthesis protein BcsQ